MNANRLKSIFRVFQAKAGKPALYIPVVVLLFYFILTAWNLSAFRDEIYSDTRNYSFSLARSLGEKLGLVGDTVENSIDSIARVFIDRGSLNDPALYQRLAAVERQTRFVQRAIILDAQGNLVADSGAPGPESVSFADRDYFTYHRDNESSDVRMGAPGVERLSGRASLPITRRLEGSDGRFLGVVGIAVDLDALRPNLLELAPHDDSAIAVFHEDGTLLLRAPDPEGVAGRSFLGYPLFTEHLPRRDAGFFLAEDQSDGTARYVAYTRVEGRSMVVAVAVSRWEVFAPWRTHAAIELTKLVLLALAGAVLSAAAVRAARARRKAEANFSSTLDVALSAERRHRTVLDAIPANLVLLDRDGTVLLTNSNWQHFADANDYPGESHGVGLNYLEICDNATGKCAEEAAPAAEGIRLVLDGTRKEFSLEYPCHAPGKDRWFRLLVGPVDLGDRRGVVAMHLDITVRKLAEIALKSERARLSGLAEAVPGVLFRIARAEDKSFRWVSIDPRCVDIFGIRDREVVEEGEVFSRLVPPAELPRLLDAFAAHMTRQEPLDVEFPIRRADGRVLWLRALGSADASEGEGGEAISDGILLDITGERDAQGELDYLRSHDVLTGLPNRGELLRRLEKMVSGRPHGARRDFALHLIGIDDFADINEAYGMAVGDSVLQAVAERLQVFVRSGDLLARIGGDTFAIVQAGLLTDSDAATLASKTLEAFHQPVRLMGQTIRLGVSIGISKPKGGGASADVVLNSASSALRRAKADGRALFRFDVDRSGLETQTRVALREGLAVALERGEFELHFQPRVRVRDGAITGGEALLRWAHPIFGMQSPGRFIPVAERSGQIIPIGEWVLMETCRLARGWIDAGEKNLRFAVNVSAIQLRRTDFVSSVEKALSEHGIPPGALEIELTEAAAFDRDFGDTLKRLRELGLSIAIDDFGTGYSSLSYLRRFPIDALKIDQSFIRQSLASEADEAMVRTIIGLARSLDISTVAEGVELAEQLALLQRLGCDEIQGFYFAPPMAAEDFGWFLTEGGSQILEKLRATAPSGETGGRIARLASRRSDSGEP